MRTPAIVILLLFLPAVCAGGLFDDVLNRAKEVTQDAMEKVEGVTGGGEEQGQEPPASKSSSEPTEETSAQSDTGDATAASASGAHPTRNDLRLACLKYVPEILDDEALLKQYVGWLFPDEAGITYNNEFAWRKRKGEFKERILTLAASAPERFEYAPWTTRPRLTAYRYDFDREAFKVGAKKYITLPPFARSNWSPESLEWLPMPPDLAETVANRYRTETRPLYGHYVVEVLDADYRSMDPRRPDSKACSPRVRVEQIDLYLLGEGVSSSQARQRSDFEYLTSLEVGP